MRSETLGTKFAESRWGKDLQNELKPIEDKLKTSGEKLPDKAQFTSLAYNTNPCTQFLVVSGRTLKNLYRNPRTSTVQAGYKR